MNMDTAVAIQTLEATYVSSADAAAVESMIGKLIEKEMPTLYFYFDVGLYLNKELIN